MNGVNGTIAPQPERSSKTAFCQSLPWRARIEWFDLTGLVYIDQERHAKLTLTEGGVVGDYVGLRVEIQSKRTGPLDLKTFRFCDYMNPDDPAERADNRRDYPGPFVVVAQLGWRWYIAVPKNPEKFTSAIERYIDLWK
jgi:hypothetical protein